MQTRRGISSRVVAAATAAALTAALVAAVPAGAQPPPTGGDAAVGAITGRTTTGASTVTLITGDRVTLTDRAGAAVQRGPGRDGVTFLAHRLGEHHYVIPSDALPLIRSGQVDLRLFDVAGLVAAGYDDRRDDLPLILGQTRTAAATTVRAESAGGEVVRELPAAEAVAVRVEKTETAGFWADLTDDFGDDLRLDPAVGRVWLDGLRQPALADSVPQVGAPAAWDAGWDGTGVTVAVLDTGIDAEHPDLADRIADAANFTEAEDDRDLVGHGTHVAGIVAGSGAASGGDYRGVAPGAQLLDGKVCIDYGCPESAILAGMQWAAEQGAEVVNLSLGGYDQLEVDPLEEAVAALTEEYGVLFVVAAGNAGMDSSINTPASADAALAVGAVDRDDELADFSSRGPRIDGALKPDLTAPGVDIVAADSRHGFLGDPVGSGGPYVSMSGTSMAAPHAAGAAAVLRQQRPDWSPAQVKTALMNSAATHSGIDVFGQGAGRLDLARAVTQTVLTEPASVGFDRQPWPHDDDLPQTHEVTFHNGGDEDVTLELEIQTTGPAGEAPAGMFGLSDSEVAVPAGDSATVSLTADTAVGELDGFFGGHLTATAGDLRVVTPFGVDREVESYDLTLEHLDRSGQPAADHLTALVSLDPFRWYESWGEESTSTLRVPAGEYLLFSSLAADQESDRAVLVQPRLAVTGEQTLRLDARDAEPVSVSIPDAAAEPVAAIVGAEYLLDDGGVSLTWMTEGLDGVFTAQLGPDEPIEGFQTVLTGVWGVPGPDGELATGTVRYDLAWFIADRFATGFERDVRRAELARIEADHAVGAPESSWVKTRIPVSDAGAGGWGFDTVRSEPMRRTEYVNTEGLQWIGLFDEWVDESTALLVVLDGELTRYRPGRSYRESWNRAVLGPQLPSELSGVVREDDTLWIVPALYGDAAGNRGWAPADVTMTVDRDGTRIAELAGPYGEVAVGPEPADYRVEIDAGRAEPAVLSTRTHLVWEFRSGGDGDGEPQPQPLTVARFTPKLDGFNRAPAGRLFPVPVRVEGPGGAAVPGAALTVEVSFDDGRSWRRAPLVPGLGNRHALVVHPAGSGFVSLRATITDSSGSKTEQTVIRAYETS